MIFLYLLIIFLNDIYLTRSTELNENYNLPTNLSLDKQLQKKFAQKKNSEIKFHQLNQRIAKDTEYFEEIPHFAVNSSKNIKRKQRIIQSDFKKVIGMVGVKYTYKRGGHWRTWREINYSNRTEVVCYRCQNVVDTAKTNCTNCHFGGHWVIEDTRPLCSYEILSFKNKNELCVADFWQLNKANISSCLSTIPYNELWHCGVPIVTEFLVTKDYSKDVSERSLAAICQGRERCDFSTVYIVNPASIVFRIVNPSNDIIYSRIMKNNGNSYVCVEDCGNFDFNTMTAKRNEDHLVLNLLSPSKTKRDSSSPKSHKQNRKTKSLKKINTKPKGSLKKRVNLNSISKNIHLMMKKHKYILERPLNREHTTAPGRLLMCKQILLKELMDDLNM